MCRRDCSCEENPKATIYNLIAYAGAQVARNFIDSGREWILSSKTWRYLNVFSKESRVVTYKSCPSQNLVREAFIRSRQNLEETLSISSNDYKWKSKLRKLTSPSAPLLSCLEDSATMYIPTSATVRLGYDKSEEPTELIDLMALYNGRIPLSLTVSADCNGHAIFKLPESPWLIKLPENCYEILLNNARIYPHLSADGRWRLIGAGDLEGLGFDYLKGSNLEMLIILEGSLPITAYLPFNALAYNSGNLKVTLR